MYKKMTSIMFNNHSNKKIRLYSTRFHSNKPPNNNNILIIAGLLGLFLTIKNNCKYK
jgi:hypothetical protein